MVSRTENTRPIDVVKLDPRTPMVVRNGEIVAVLTGGGVNAHYQGVKRRKRKLATSRRRQHVHLELAKARRLSINEIDGFDLVPCREDKHCIDRRCVS